MFRISRMRPPLRECAVDTSDSGKYKRSRSQMTGFLAYFIATGLNLFWLTCLVAFHNNWRDHNTAIYAHTNLPMWLPLMEFYALVCVGFLLYLALLGALSLLSLMEATTPLELKPEHLYTLILAIAAPLAWFIGYSIMWENQFALVIRAMELILPALHCVCCVLLIAMVHPITIFIFRSDSRRKMFIKLGLALLFYAVIYSVPFYGNSIHILTKPLPPKPLIVGHRGAPDEAPENTLPSFKIAMDLNVDIIESDVTISYDGIPFMLHLGLLKGSTNVRSVFPHREHDHASNFTMKEIQRLDAGFWDLKFRGTKVPTLEETITLLKTNPKVKLMFDVVGLQHGHPFFGQEREIVKNVVKKMNFSSQFVWLQIREFGPPLDPVAALRLRTELPGVTIISGHEVGTLSQVLDRSSDVINFEWDQPNVFITPLSSYNASMVYLVNAEWLFDQMWSLGAHWVITNYPRYYLHHHEPHWVKTQSQYLFFVFRYEFLCGVLTFWLATVTFITSEHNIEVPLSYKQIISKREVKIGITVALLLVLFLFFH